MESIPVQFGGKGVGTISKPLQKSRYMVALLLFTNVVSVEIMEYVRCWQCLENAAKLILQNN